MNGAMKNKSDVLRKRMNEMMKNKSDILRKMNRIMEISRRYRNGPRRRNNNGERKAVQSFFPLRSLHHTRPFLFYIMSFILSFAGRACHHRMAR